MLWKSYPKFLAKELQRKFYLGKLQVKRYLSSNVIIAKSKNKGPKLLKNKMFFSLCSSYKSEMLIFRGVCSTLWNVYDGAFLRKWLMAFKITLYFISDGKISNAWNLTQILSKLCNFKKSNKKIVVHSQFLQTSALLT